MDRSMRLRPEPAASIPGGRTRHLAAKDFTLTPGKTWTSGPSGGRYPVEWTIEGSIVGLQGGGSNATRISRNSRGSKGSGINYWEGAIDVDATRRGVSRSKAWGIWR